MKNDTKNLKKNIKSPLLSTSTIVTFMYFFKSNKKNACELVLALFVYFDTISYVLHVSFCLMLLGKAFGHNVLQEFMYIYLLLLTKNIEGKNVMNTV